ncbi:MAG: cyclopropane-fatty-acyl-phospholipid synthase family protein [Pseudomonadota bacterium]
MNRHTMKRKSLPIVAKKLFQALEQIEYGKLNLTGPNGEKFVFGCGEPEVEFKFRDWGVFNALAARGDIGLGETYVAGLWDCSSIDLLTQIAFKNEAVFEKNINGSFLNRLYLVLTNNFVRRNNRKGSRVNIKSHYDVGNEFYRLWLDKSMTYSSALYSSAEGDDTSDLEQAQYQKYERLLNITKDSGNKLLEIGCGWGGFAEQAIAADRDLTAVTISEAQQHYTQKRLGPKADIRLQDYRDITGKFDSIISIEMIEAVGEKYWPTYFKKLKECLAEGGRSVIQAIIVEDDHFPNYRRRSDYIRHYTFPGGMLLCPSKITQTAKKVGLSSENLYRFGQDYAKTLREWLKRFGEAEEDIRKLGYSEEFIRSWEFYLQVCAAAFTTGRTDVVHFELKHA